MGRPRSISILALELLCSLEAEGFGGFVWSESKEANVSPGGRWPRSRTGRRGSIGTFPTSRGCPRPCRIFPLATVLRRTPASNVLDVVVARLKRKLQEPVLTRRARSRLPDDLLSGEACMGRRTGLFAIGSRHTVRPGACVLGSM